MNSSPRSQRLLLSLRPLLRSAAGQIARATTRTIPTSGPSALRRAAARGPRLGAKARQRSRSRRNLSCRVRRSLRSRGRPWPQRQRRRVAAIPEAVGHPGRPPSPPRRGRPTPVAEAASPLCRQPPGPMQRSQQRGLQELARPGRQLPLRRCRAPHQHAEWAVTAGGRSRLRRRQRRARPRVPPGRRAPLTRGRPLRHPAASGHRARAGMGPGCSSEMLDQRGSLFHVRLDH